MTPFLFHPFTNIFSPLSPATPYWPGCHLIFTLPCPSISPPSFKCTPPFLPHQLNYFLRLQAIEMRNEIHCCAESGNLERARQLAESGANIDEADDQGRTALLLACYHCHFKIVVYLVERGANVAHTDNEGTTALHCASRRGYLPTVRYLLEHGARITERDGDGRTALLYAAHRGQLRVVKYLLSSEGGASITETDDAGNTALLLAAGRCTIFYPPFVQWLLEHGGAQITDVDNRGKSVWSDRAASFSFLSLRLRETYKRNDAGEYVPTANTARLTTMLRAMVLHGGPPESLTAALAPPLQRIVQDGARLRARLPAYLAQRRALVDAHCPLLPPLRALVHGYEEPTTTDEFWATGLGATLQRAKRPRS